MKLTDLRPCDNCQGKLVPTFYVVRFSQALFNARAANQVLGLNQIFGGSAFGLAEAFAPNPDGAVMVFGDKDPSLQTELLVCQECFTMQPIDLARLSEERSHAQSKDSA